MGRNRKFTSERSLAEAWEEYKKYCDSKTVIRTEFSQRLGQFITAEIPHPVTYTIKGFCLWCGLTEQAFYAKYAKDNKIELVIARMKEDCERDCREKFENGTIPTQLSGLWMSHYGYSTSTKVEADVKPVVISGADALED